MAWAMPALSKRTPPISNPTTKALDFTRFGKEFEETEGYAKLWDAFHAQDFRVELYEVKRSAIQGTPTSCLGYPSIEM